ncbi:hypothetical protein VNO77_31007 [Canavalia gladiata]|uniref:Uncharacterized protein n=1 Tax=Canavalia gladiata TaxID=3824 RepID=A0AAN9Q4H3_CANGL
MELPKGIVVIHQRKKLELWEMSHLPVVFLKGKGKTPQIGFEARVPRFANKRRRPSSPKVGIYVPCSSLPNTLDAPRMMGEGLSSLISKLDSSLLMSLQLPCKETMTHSLWSIRRNSRLLVLDNKYKGRVPKASCTCYIGTRLCDVAPRLHAYGHTSSYVSQPYAFKSGVYFSDLHDHSLGFCLRVTRGFYL